MVVSAFGTKKVEVYTVSTAYAGKGGDFTYNSVAYQSKTWSLDVDDSLVDCSSQVDSGWRSYVSGLRGASWSVECVFDPSLAQLTPGQSLTNLRLGISSSLKVIFNGL